jgi:hypothetical protein
VIAGGSNSIQGPSQMPNATVRANARALSASDEAASKPEDPKVRASQEFSRAHYAWLAARAALEDPSIEGDEMTERYKVELDAERRFFAGPASYGDELWTKLVAFEDLLNDELESGPRRDSILLLALGCIKQDFVNLNVVDAIAEASTSHERIFRAGGAGS